MGRKRRPHCTDISKGTLNLRAGWREELRKILRRLAWASGTQFHLVPGNFLMNAVASPLWSQGSLAPPETLEPKPPTWESPFHSNIYYNGENSFLIFFKVSFEACPPKSNQAVFISLHWSKSPYQWLWVNVDVLNHICGELNSHPTTLKRDLLYNLMPRIGQSNYYWL